MYNFYERLRQLLKEMPEIVTIDDVYPAEDEEEPVEWKITLDNGDSYTISVDEN